jgi:transposase-like protein
MAYCPGCYSNVLKKKGYDRKRVQKYKCLRCGKNFTENTDSQLSGMRYPKTLITYALTLHYRHKMTYREVARELKKRGIEISYVTVYNWAKKFGGVFERTHGGFRPYTRIWNVRSNMVNINGKEYYFSSVHDSNRNILSIHVSKRQAGSGCLLGDARKLTGFRPETVMGADAEMFKPTKGDVKA